MVTAAIVKKKLKEYLIKLKSQIPIEKAYLVGSWVSGKATEESDVDLLILSSAFSRMDMDERLRILYKNTVGIDFDLHIHAVTDSELKNASQLTTLGAIRSGKKIPLIFS